jgi:hypothetical protein
MLAMAVSRPAIAVITPGRVLQKPRKPPFSSSD